MSSAVPALPSALHALLGAGHALLAAGHALLAAATHDKLSAVARRRTDLLLAARELGLGGGAREA